MSSTGGRRAWLVAMAAGLLSVFPVTTAAEEKAEEKFGTLEIRAVDEATGKSVAARMHLKDAAGKPVRAPGVPNWNDHFVFDGAVTLKLPAGEYRYEMERGPEYYLESGEVTIETDKTARLDVKLKRMIEMKQRGWWSGETHIHRPLRDVQLLMRAEDLHVGPVITWWNRRNLWAGKKLPEKLLVRFDGDRFLRAMAGEDERGGGALMYFNLDEPLPITKAEREHPSPVTFLKLAKKQPTIHGPVHVDVEKPFWWDAPTWVATGLVDSIGLANNHMQRDGMLDGEAWGRPRDREAYPSPGGNGLWTQYIYYQMLNCGLRIAPSAGSASGVLKNPVGYNRVYVHCGEKLSYDAWWKNLRAGRVVVTNGPLLLPRVNGQLPGHVFKADAGKSIRLSIQVETAIRDKVKHLEVVRDGQVIQKVPLGDDKTPAGEIEPVEFRQSGWLLVRAVADHPKTFRFASTGPYYVQIGEKPRVSRKSATFLRNWVRRRVDRFELAPAQRREVLAPHTAAIIYWQGLVETANAD